MHNIRIKNNLKRMFKDPNLYLKLILITIHKGG